jgi:hypothetical protein
MELTVPQVGNWLSANDREHPTEASAASQGMADGGRVARA